MGSQADTAHSDVAGDGEKWSEELTVRAAVVEAPGGEFSAQTITMDAIRPDEIFVRVAAVGICQTDLHTAAGDMGMPTPSVLGHEGAGIVEQVGEAVRSVSVGDHVIMTFPSCGRCPACLSGAPANCYQGFSLSFGGQRADGSSGYQDVHGHFFGQSSFAEVARTTERNVVRVDSDLDLGRIAPLGCGIQTGAGAVLNTFDVGVGDTIVINGTGTVGLAAVLAASIAGAGEILAVDINDDRLQLAEEFGATATVNSADKDLVAEAKRLRPDGFDFGLEVTAIPEHLDLLLGLVAPMGTVGLVGGAAVGTKATIDMNTLMNGSRIVRGIVQGESQPQDFLPRLLSLIRSGRFPIDRLITRYSFDDIATAVADMRAGTVIKPVLVHS